MLLWINNQNFSTGKKKDNNPWTIRITLGRLGYKDLAAVDTRNLEFCFSTNKIALYIDNIQFHYLPKNYQMGNQLRISFLRQIRCKTMYFVFIFFLHSKGLPSRYLIFNEVEVIFFLGSGQR